MSLFLSIARRVAKPFPRVYFDLKAFRKGIAEKKSSLLEAEKREIDRAFAKEAPAGWSISDFLRKSQIGKLGDLKGDDLDRFYSEVAACFENWNDFISSSRKDLFRVSNLLNPKQVKSLAHHLELFNHGLFPKPEPSSSVFQGKPLANADKEWTSADDEQLLELATQKYDHTFGNPWLFISWDMQRSVDAVRARFVEIFLKPKNASRNSEICLSKSFRPLLMNRQFRLIPPQCVIVPSEANFPSGSAKFELPEKFLPYRNSDSF